MSTTASFLLALCRQILKRGVDVVHSDADAVWVQNPFPLLAYAEPRAAGRLPGAAALSARQHKLMSRASLVRFILLRRGDCALD
jgi:hypothetical protein